MTHPHPVCSVKVIGVAIDTIVLPSVVSRHSTNKIIRYHWFGLTAG
ncbi:MAG: hypothetical protein IPJ88_06325 [Myxococcales bacterium]|nr:MAG: hypothetical protein IPJ88_06325 [Myxococcales bacterium]